MAACSSSDTDTSGGEGGSGGDSSGAGNTGNTSTTGSKMTTTTSTTTASSMSTSMSTMSTASSMGGCADMATFDDCASCFDMMDPDGYTAFATHLVFNCGCDAMAPCLMDCDTMDMATDVCGDGGMVNLDAMTPDACVTCINGVMQGDACLTGFQMDCGADQTCADFIAELQTCPPP
jgi:hypothetical protein